MKNSYNTVVTISQYHETWDFAEIFVSSVILNVFLEFILNV